MRSTGTAHNVAKTDGEVYGGVKNLLDTDPPFTAHNLDFAAGAGGDPRVADPRGRAFTLRVNYKFF